MCVPVSPRTSSPLISLMRISGHARRQRRGRRSTTLTPPAKIGVFAGLRQGPYRLLYSRPNCSWRRQHGFHRSAASCGVNFVAVDEAHASAMVTISAEYVNSDGSAVASRRERSRV